MVDKWSRWYGAYKDYTKDCNSCSDHKIIDGEDWCYYGVGKRLSRPDKKLRKCSYARK